MLALILGIISVLLLTKIIFKSISIVFKVLINIVVGIVTLFIFNAVFSGFGLAIIINPITSFLVGFFGLPAVVVLVILKVFL